VRSGKAKRVIAYNQSRLFRDMGEASAFRKLCEKKGVELVLTQMGRPIDWDNDYVLFSATAMIDDVYARQVSKNVRDWVRRRKEAGKKAGGPTPYGYDAEPDGTLVPNAIEQAAIAYMRQLRAQGLGYVVIAQCLEISGHLSKTGLSRWNSKTVWKILRAA
jgi:DNA invertase Pin-like site-specific DNA recombinase